MEIAKTNRFLCFQEKPFVTEIKHLHNNLTSTATGTKSSENLFKVKCQNLTEKTIGNPQKRKHFKIVTIYSHSIKEQT